MRSLYTGERAEEECCEPHSCRLCSEMSLLPQCLLKNQKYARNGHLTGALKWFLSKAATLVEAVWNKQQLRYVIGDPKAVLCDHRAKGLRPLGTRSSPHPIMPLSAKHCTSSTLNPPRHSGLGHSPKSFLNEKYMNFNCINYG